MDTYSQNANKQIGRQDSTKNVNVIDLRDLAERYLKKWYWFAISVCLCVGIAGVYLWFAVPQYRVQTTLLLRDDRASNPVSQLSMLDGFSIGSNKVVEDEILVLSSKTIVSNLVRSLHLGTTYYAKEGGGPYLEYYPSSSLRLDLPQAFTDTLTATLRFKVKEKGEGYEVKFLAKKERYRFRKSYRLARIDEAFVTPWGEIRFAQVAPFEEKTKFLIVCLPHRVAVENYSEDISVGLVNMDANVISASMVAESREKAVATLNELVRLYNIDVSNDKKLVGENASLFFGEQIANLEVELSDIEMKIERYKRANNLTDLSSESRLFLETVGEYDKQLAEIQTQINLMAYVDNHLRNSEDPYVMVPANLGVDDASLLALIDDYNNALLRRLKLLRTTNEHNPVITQMESSLQVIRASILSSIQSITDGLQIAKSDLLAKGEQFDLRIREVPRQEREYIEMRRRREVTQSLYLFLLQKSKEDELSMATTLPPARVIDKAYPSLKPVSPRKLLILCAALLAGVCLPLSVFYLYDLFNNTVQDTKEFRRLVRAPYLGYIPLFSSRTGAATSEKEKKYLAEMFRLLRTGLLFMLGNNKKCPVIMVTSGIPGEGKTFVSSHLALSFSLMKKRVALVGLDLRNPKLSEHIHLPEAHTGASVYLSDAVVDLSEITYRIPDNPYLDVIQSGPIPPNSTELLMGPRLEELINELKETHDYIIIDSPPVSIVSDAFVINRVSDSTVCVSRRHHTTRDIVSLINELYEEKNLNNLSVVFNGVDKTPSSYAYYRN